MAKKKSAEIAKLAPKTIDYISVDDLLYDPENPRLPHTIVNSHDEAEVINWMLSDASILELMGSIGLKGFFEAEPLLVVPGKDNKFIVVEGNRRLTAVKLLRNPALAEKRSKAVLEISKEAVMETETVPVIKYENRKQILDYLGFKHITGVKPWPALAKAKYLQQLQPEYKNLKRNDQYKALAKAIGSRSDYVKDLLSTVDIYDKMAKKDFFDIPGLKEDTIDFGVYYNAMKYSGIAKYIGVDEKLQNPNAKLDLNRLKDLASWISEKDENKQTRLGESRNLGLLNQVLDNPKALALFKSGRKLDDAVTYTGEPSELVQQAINESFTQLQYANTNGYLVTKPSESAINTLKEIIAIAETLVESFNAKLLKNKVKRK
ncbi:ParB N-terminal domain-containing protein [Ferruginibacter sp. SUN106]|uniref:ParB N-terminal domain-containing protein n=1 Tax=Ferruginibacter sp. SUN106 TaxID=2978348 RepID=UPI003D36CECA